MPKAAMGRADRDADPIKHEIKHERRIGPRDQKKNARVIDILKCSFCSDVRNSMVQSTG